MHVGEEPVGGNALDHFAVLRRRNLRVLHRENPPDRDVRDRVERRVVQRQGAVDRATIARFLMAAYVYERGLGVEALAVGRRADLEVEVDLVAGGNVDRRAERAVDDRQREAHAVEASVQVITISLDRHTTDLLGLAVRLATADRRLLRRHGHEQRVLAFDASVAGPDAEPSRAEHRDAGAHVDRGEPNPRPGVRRLERRWQHGSDRVGVGFPDHRHGRRPDLLRRRFDFAVALLLGWTSAVSNRHDRESSTATRAFGRAQHGREKIVHAVEGKVAVVTGGANGIGLAMGRHFAGHGMSVMLADIQPGPLDAAVALLRSEGLDVAGCHTDVTKLASVDHLADETMRAFGAVHVVCNNAGIGPGGQTLLWDYEENDWRWCLDVNVCGVAWGIKAFVPRMIR